jgi:hypothetical protein
MKDNCKDCLTYFFPIPSASELVEFGFRKMDMVVLKKDIRLLCLISPSSVNRDVINNRGDYVDTNYDTYYDNEHLHKCKDRGYDICMSNELIIGLKLNGYIGIAFSDSLAIGFQDIFIDNIDNGEYKKMLIYLASCFNNGIYTRQNNIKGNQFVEKMTDSRTYGIPEIVIIPYDLHAYPDPNDYVNVYNEFTNKVNENINVVNIHPRNIDHSHFIFRFVANTRGANAVEVGKKMAEILKNNANDFDKSLQAYPLFTLLRSEVDPRNSDYILGNRPITFDDVAFVNSYMSPSKSKSAFETNIFYEMLSESTVGGSLDIIKPENIINISRVPQIANKKEPLRIKNIGFNIQNKKPIQFENENIYYNEINGIPIIVYKKNKPIPLGGRKRKKHYKKTFKKPKNKQKKRSKTKRRPTYRRYRLHH